MNTYKTVLISGARDGNSIHKLEDLDNSIKDIEIESVENLLWRESIENEKNLKHFENLRFNLNSARLTTKQHKPCGKDSKCSSKKQKKPLVSARLNKYSSGKKTHKKLTRDEPVTSNEKQELVEIKDEDHHDFSSRVKN